MLPHSELAHQRNVRRENIENMTRVLLKQIKQRALLASGCPGGLVLEEQPMLSTSGPPAASALLMWPRPHFSTLLHGGVAGDVPNGMESSALVSPGPG